MGHCTPMRMHPFSRLLAEFIGTMFLLATVIGSGIFAQRLSEDPGLQLLENTLATGAALVALIFAFGPISGAHFNPAVTLAAWALGELRGAEVGPYIASQIAGGICGTLLANLMFDLAPVTLSTTERTGANLWLAEVVATVGLLVIIFAVVRAGKGEGVAWAVGGYITAAYWFTSSTSFANPAVTIARTLSDTFAGIMPESAPAFIVAQLIGTVIAILAVLGLTRAEPELPF